MNGVMVMTKSLRRRTWTIGIATCLAVASCTDAELGGGGAGDDTVAGDDVLVEEPTPDPVVSEDEIVARQERIRAYFAERVERLDIVATTVTQSGQVIDWIRPESQTSDGFIATPPDGELAPDPGMPDGEAGPNQAEPPPQVGEPAFTDLQLQPEALGPEGTVPVVRFDVEAYLAAVETPPEDPLEVISKVPPAPAPASNDRYYAVSQQNGTFYGTAGFINVHDTTGPTNGDDTSIMQTAVIRGNPMQAIEAGKIEWPAGTTPTFFVYFRTGGEAHGDWKGGYNQNVDGWVQYSKRVVPAIELGPVSTVNGTQFEFGIEARLHQGNWWVGAFGEWAGYYPHCEGGDAQPCDTGTLFSASGIRDEASRMDWFGEVFDSSAPAATSTDMGSGEFANGGYGRAAYIRNMIEVFDPSYYRWWDTESTWATDGDCYTVFGVWRSNVDGWRNWFFLGGPGKEADACT